MFKIPGTRKRLKLPQFLLSLILSVFMFGFQIDFANSVNASTSQINYISTDTNGVKSYSIVSDRNGPGTHTLRVLEPNNPAAGMAHNFLYVLPVSAESVTTYGDGLEELRNLNAQNTYNVTIIAPSFDIPPWYADSDSNTNYRYESFMTLELQPWVIANLSTSGTEQHWLLGFSKSGYGSATLLFKNPDLFTLAAFWDFPADMSSYNTFEGGASNYGTQANFDNNYRLTSTFIENHKAPFLKDNRIWINGYGNFQTQVENFDTLLTAKSVRHTTAPEVPREHRWDSGWIPSALAGLYNNSLNIHKNFPTPSINLVAPPVNLFNGKYRLSGNVFMNSNGGTSSLRTFQADLNGVGYGQINLSGGRNDGSGNITYDFAYDFNPTVGGGDITNNLTIKFITFAFNAYKNTLFYFLPFTFNSFNVSNPKLQIFTFSVNKIQSQRVKDNIDHFEVWYRQNTDISKWVKYVDNISNSQIDKDGVVVATKANGIKFIGPYVFKIVAVDNWTNKEDSNPLYITGTGQYTNLKKVLAIASMEPAVFSALQPTPYVTEEVTSTAKIKPGFVLIMSAGTALIFLFLLWRRNKIS